MNPRVSCTESLLGGQAEPCSCLPMGGSLPAQLELGDTIATFWNGYSSEQNGKKLFMELNSSEETQAAHTVTFIVC